MSDKQNEAKSYREFWVNEYITSVHYAGDPFYGGKTGREELPYIHVIEYEALAKLQAEINRLTYELDKSRQSHVNLIDKLQKQNEIMREHLVLAISLASHRFDCTVMTNGKHECNCGYNELKVGSECATNGTNEKAHKCHDPAHSSDSISSKVYYKCPSCGEMVLM